ncbi:adaptor related protein complex 3 subunit sigma 2 [Homo sapiens]|uniref:Isoform 3 of AP-3 complex subunit sigma-2 n=1 Tax=Homo sapiens TaxID=9606 RepID=P59780-2|nr:adaptor-related protein complex 3, sigma 2 subunit, isoform CRA_c [Homo sapiens]KAI2575816.1 adaptor related protein complex 3 subunit sigma 2 [Homo sapiens]KAI2575817.1 adaptor related protein complex 3 subunit sigma 2 [Homo sapiens]KAI4059410.1 adaptor related protein complex 3 subunit sigma 2 [Homo sapiens]KAI4059414.1 adaptor related protein complex 3 subunit sigma 2 [Homo sapiens]
MIQAILVFNNHGKPRLVRFYQRFPEEIQQQIVRETFHLVLKRDDNICNFLEGGSLIGGSDYKLIYRHYATLYFVFCVDSSESELGILDLIQLKKRERKKSQCNTLQTGTLALWEQGPDIRTRRL